MEPQNTKINVSQIHKQNVVIWIDNEDKSEAIVRPSDQEFKKQHLNYIAQKMRRRQEEKKMIQQQYGDSSSSEDEEKPALEKITSTDRSSPLPHKYELSISNKSSKDASEQDGPQPKIYQNVNISPSMKQYEELPILIESKNNGQWNQGILELTQNKVKLPGKDIAYYDINKLKLILSTVGQSNYKLKITCKKQEFIFAASFKTCQKDLPLCFYIFASIINRKLSLMGCKLGPLLPPTQNIPPHIIKQSLMFGSLLKKARVISKWNEVVGVVIPAGLYYYKGVNDKGSLLVPRGTINELWTRFELMEQKLIVKLFQKSSKIQLGIPIYNYSAVEGWLYHLYLLKHSYFKK